MNLLVPLLGKIFFTIFHHIQDLQEPTSVLKKIDSLQISKLKDSSKESRVSSMSKNFSDEKPPRAIVMPGEIKKGNPCLH